MEPADWRVVRAISRQFVMYSIELMLDGAPGAQTRFPVLLFSAMTPIEWFLRENGEISFLYTSSTVEIVVESSELLTNCFKARIPIRDRDTVWKTSESVGVQVWKSSASKSSPIVRSGSISTKTNSDRSKITKDWFLGPQISSVPFLHSPGTFSHQKVADLSTQISVTKSPQNQVLRVAIDQDNLVWPRDAISRQSDDLQNRLCSD